VAAVAFCEEPANKTAQQKRRHVLKLACCIEPPSALWGLELAKSFQLRKEMIGSAGLTLETRFGEVKLEEE
jgi:hypothetical protein